MLVYCERIDGRKGRVGQEYACKMISDQRTQSARQTMHLSFPALALLIRLTNWHHELRSADHRKCGPGMSGREQIEWIMVEGSKARGRRLARLPTVIESLTSAVSNFVYAYSNGSYLITISRIRTFSGVRTSISIIYNETLCKHTSL